MFLVLRGAVVTVNGVDLSDCCSSVEIEEKADEVETTRFVSSYEEYGQGMKNAIVTLEFFQDFAAGKVDQTLWPLSVSGGLFEVTVKPDTGPASETNPLFRMTTQLHGYSPIAGAVGEALITELTFRNAHPDGLTRLGAYVGVVGVDLAASAGVSSATLALTADAPPISSVLHPVWADYRLRGDDDFWFASLAA